MKMAMQPFGRSKCLGGVYCGTYTWLKTGSIATEWFRFRRRAGILANGIGLWSTTPSIGAAVGGLPVRWLLPARSNGYY
jgi:hypothetical protein